MDLVLGTMRLLDSSEKQTISLLERALLLGVRRFHSSSEYESFGRFSSALAIACESTGVDPTSLQHTIKIADPGFDESTFDSKRLKLKIDLYRKRLNAPKIDTVQWMARAHLKDDSARIKLLHDMAPSIEAAVNDMKQSNIINKFGCFPYSDSFRAAVLDMPWCDVLVDYTNRLETAALKSSQYLRDDQSIIGIRPFFPLTQEDPDIRARWSFNELLEFVLHTRTIEGLVVSTSSEDHLQQLLEKLRK